MFSRTAWQAFIADEVLVAASEHRLQIAIQACMDIANHLVAQMALDKPKKDNKEIFIILGKHRIIDIDLAQRLKNMGGMRNILVHQYLEVDVRKVYEVIVGELSDIEEYVKEIQEFLDKQKQSGFTPIVIILALLVVAGLVGGAYYFGKQSSNTNQSANTTYQVPSARPTNVSISSSTAQALNETANWKVYTSPSLKISFTYPSEANVHKRESSDNSADAIQVDYDDTKDVGGGGPRAGWYIIVDKISKSYPGRPDLKQWAWENGYTKGNQNPDRGPTYAPPKVVDITLGGKSGIKWPDSLGRHYYFIENNQDNYLYFYRNKQCGW